MRIIILYRIIPLNGESLVQSRVRTLVKAIIDPSHAFQGMGKLIPTKKTLMFNIKVFLYCLTYLRSLVGVFFNTHFTDDHVIDVVINTRTWSFRI